MLPPSQLQLVLPTGAAVSSRLRCCTKIFLFKIHGDSDTPLHPCRGCVSHPPPPPPPAPFLRERLWAGARLWRRGWLRLRWPSSWRGSHSPAWPVLFPRQEAGPDNKFSRALLFKKNTKSNKQTNGKHPKRFPDPLGNSKY